MQPFYAVRIVLFFVARIYAWISRIQVVDSDKIITILLTFLLEDAIL